MATPSERQPILEQRDEVETGVLTGEKLEIKEFGNTVNIENYMYSKTNFYINQSRPYVGKRKLTQYVFIKWLHWIYIIVFIGTLFVLFNEYIAFIMLGVNLVILAIYTQNIYVNFYTMMFVLKQPSVPDHQQRRSNTFYEITLEEFAAVYVGSHRAGLGHVLHAKGTVKIQVFRHSAMQVMKKCVVTSTVCFLASLFSVMYCLVWGSLRASEANDSDGQN